MNKGEIRDQQLAILIAEELESVLYAAEDPRLSELIITRVEPTKGGRHFLISVMPEAGSRTFRSITELKQVLERASKYLRSEVTSALNLKRSPELTIAPDPLIALLP